MSYIPGSKFPYEKSPPEEFAPGTRSDLSTSLPCLRIAHSKCPVSLSLGEMVRV